MSGFSPLILLRKNRKNLKMVENLSNEQLFRALRGAGLNPGPVTDLTRKFYNKKLNNYYKSSQASPYAMSVVRASLRNQRPQRGPVQGEWEGNQPINVCIDSSCYHLSFILFCSIKNR